MGNRHSVETDFRPNMSSFFSKSPHPSPSPSLFSIHIQCISASGMPRPQHAIQDNVEVLLSYKGLAIVVHALVVAHAAPNLGLWIWGISTVGFKQQKRIARMSRWKFVNIWLVNGYYNLPYFVGHPNQATQKLNNPSEANHEKLVFGDWENDVMKLHTKGLSGWWLNQPI